MYRYSKKKNLFSKIKTYTSLLLSNFKYRFYLPDKTDKNIIESFHKIYFYYYKFLNLGPTHPIKWMGFESFKSPLDLWIFQETIYETKTDLIIETGTRAGGSALYYANIFDLKKKGNVISVDITNKKNIKILPKHKRIKYIQGSSTSDKIIREIKKNINKAKNIMVTLDSDHSYNHVKKEINLYSTFVTKKNYLIVEDTHLSGHPIGKKGGKGPYEAVMEFVKKNKKFKIDKSKEKFLLTSNPNGFLKRN